MIAPVFTDAESKVAEQLVKLALQEDVYNFFHPEASGDHSSLSCIPADTSSRMRLICKAEGILSGLPVAEWVCRLVDDSIQIRFLKSDGDRVFTAEDIAYAEGPTQSLLRAERVLLNYIQRMSGIATLTRTFVDAVSHTSVKLLDTRKTTPNNRVFEKYAVRCGGGYNHRFGLFDRIMVKDNHIDMCGGIEAALDRVTDYLDQHNLKLPVEIETRNLDEIQRVLKHGGADRIMLDNFSPVDARRGVEMIRGEMETEISGGVTFETLTAYAETGVDFISVGAFTHSFRALDFSFKAR